MLNRRGSTGVGSQATSVTSYPATCISSVPLAGRDVDKLLLGSVPEQRPLLLAGTGAGGGRRGSSAGMHDMSTFMARAFGGGVSADEVAVARAARASSYRRDGSLSSPATEDPTFTSPAAAGGAARSHAGTEAQAASRSRRRASLGASVTAMDLAADPIAEEAAALQRRREMATRMWGPADARVESRRDPTSAVAITIAASAARRRAAAAPLPVPSAAPRAVPLRRRTGRGGGGAADSELTVEADAAGANEGRTSRRSRRKGASGPGPSRPSGSSWAAGSLDLPPQYGRDVQAAEQELDAAAAAGAAVAAAEAAAAAGGAGGRSAAASLEALDESLQQAEDSLQLLRAEEIAAARAVLARSPSPKYTLRGASAPSLHLRDGGGLVQLLGIDVDGAVAAVDAAYAAAHAAQMAAVYASSATGVQRPGRLGPSSADAGEPGPSAGADVNADSESATLTLDAEPTKSARASGTGADSAAALDTLWQLERRQPLHVLLCGPAFGLDFAEAPPTRVFGSASTIAAGSGRDSSEGPDAAAAAMIWWAGEAQRALATASRALAGHATALLLNDAGADPTTTTSGGAGSGTGPGAAGDADSEARAAWAQRSVDAATAAVSAGAADGRVLRFSNTVVQSVSSASPWHGIISAGDPLVGIDGELQM